MSETWTVLRLLTWTTDYLKSNGSGSPRLDAEVLLAHARGCERIMLYAAFDQYVDDDTRAKFRELVKRRAAGEPVAYLIGRREFYSLNFRVTPDVLIPRPETEFVVVAVLDALKSFATSEFRIQNSDLLLADVGTGSGAIAVSVAKHEPAAKLVATDISAPALAIAKENAATHGVTDRIEFLEGDLLTPLPAEPRFAVIASNPPYIGEAEISTLAPSVINHEPRRALIAGPTGTEVIERLIPQAAECLLPGGWLILEISPIIINRVVDLIATDGRFEPATITKDLANLARVIKAQRSNQI
jgi:release factor glutamine methyltransferase